MKIVAVTVCDFGECWFVLSMIVSRVISTRKTSIHMNVVPRTKTATHVLQSRHVHNWRHWVREVGDDPPTQHRTCIECGRIEVKSIVKWKLCESCLQPKHIPAG